MFFENRNQAGRLLAERLRRLSVSQPLVLGIPRGAVPMAKIVAEELGGDLDVVLVHKIGAPENPEYAIGSVSEFGTVYRSPTFEFYETSPRLLKDRVEEEVQKLKIKRRNYSPIHTPISPNQRTVIIVDDGLATGATMVSAVRAIRQQTPDRIIVAAPVASQSALEILQAEADEIVVLDSPADFYSVSQFYGDFPQISDEEVCEALSTFRPKQTTNAA